MSKISLCLIVGNVEEYIERCLDSFKPIADEICVVRAIGNQKPDRTLDICREKYGALTAEYRNKPGHENWSHVDDFAAARQMSFDLASNDYCFWCDSDDVLKQGAEAIRKHAERGGFACYMFPYDVFGKGVIVQRERLVLKSAGRWQYPVHECFKFHVEPVTAACDDSVIVQHLPKLSKSGSNQRNLKILQSIPESEMNAGLKYHLFGELIGAEKKPEAVDLACKLLEGKELGKDERYDLLLSLTLMNEDSDSRIRLLHEAHRVDPTRREALGTLATVMMDCGKPAAALAYARQMLATPEPDVHCWNSRVAFYKHTGDDIYQQALRFSGRFEAAEKVRFASFEKYGRPQIALLHATRGRPFEAAKCRKRWLDLAENPDRVEHVFAIDADDRDSMILRRFHHVMVLPGGGCVRAWNWAALNSSAKVLVQLSDDWTPPPQWDKLILDRLGNLDEPKVLAVSDGGRPDDLLCMAICTREYFGQDWFLFHPLFTGVYSDNYFTELAYQRQAIVPAKELVFEHKHPAFGTAPMDATYAAQNAPERYAQGKAVLDYLHAGVDWSTVPGFFNFWTFYEHIAGQLQDGDTVAEIGTWFGRSLIYLAQACLRLGKNVRFYAVDTFMGEVNQPAHYEAVREHGGSIRAAFEANLKRCGVAHMVTVIEGDSAASAAQIPDASLAFCYIDAAHDYESVKRDIAAWKPKVKPGGTFAGHDADCPDVERAVRECVPGVEIFGCVWRQGVK